MGERITEEQLRDWEDPGSTVGMLTTRDLIAEVRRLRGLIVARATYTVYGEVDECLSCGVDATDQHKAGCQSAELLAEADAIRAETTE